MTQRAPSHAGRPGAGSGTVPAPADPATLPARVTTPLLTLITQQSLDEDYQHVAERRRAGVPQGTGLVARARLTTVALVLFGVLVAVAAVQTARNRDVATAGREQLISRIDSRRTTLAGVQDRIARLRSTNAASDDANRSLSSRLGTLVTTRTALQRGAGFAPLAGPGVLVRVDDGPSGDENDQVRDSDLTLIVNGLWQAGATGISVNGQRLTVLSALRNTSESIRVNNVSLSPPYAVLAVGDTKTLQADFAESTSGRQFDLIREQHGMPFSMDNRQEVQLPAAPEGMMSVHDARSGSSKQQKPPVNQEETQ